MFLTYDTTSLQRHLGAGNINKFSHPSLPIFGLNYKEIVQFNKLWDETTLNSRGTIVDSDYNIVGRTFPKFFNYEEHIGPLPTGPFSVTDKMDGSLIILSNYQGRWVISTRGSFVSDQVSMAENIISEKHSLSGLDPEFSYLFELIHPANRIVVDYGGISDLYFLSSYHTREGWESLEAPKGFVSTAEYGMFASSDNALDLKYMVAEGKEGFVLRWNTGLRLKIKSHEYVRLHKLMTFVRETDIWEILLFDGVMDLEKLLDKIPDELFEYFRNIRDKILSDYEEIYNDAVAYMNAGPPRTSPRIDLVNYYTKWKHPHILFGMLDGKDYRTMIFKLIKPENSYTFQTRIPISEN